MIFVEWQAHDADGSELVADHERFDDIVSATERYCAIIQHPDVLRASLLTREGEQITTHLITYRPNRHFNHWHALQAFKSPGWSTWVDGPEADERLAPAT